MNLLDWNHWLIAVGAAAAVSAAAWRLGTLRGSGALAATAVGGVVFGFAGLAAAVVLVLFFVSASILSLLPPAGERSARGARQVLANGSVAAVAAALSSIALSSTDGSALVAFLGAVAAATADTWATEVGVRLGGTPRSILNFRPQPAGSSGAVSLVGTLAAGFGALGVGLAGVLLFPTLDSGVAVTVTVAGWWAALIDSVLGAALQCRYRCRRCGRSPQVARHDGCPAIAVRQSGLPGLDNDVVNWLATGVGALSALALAGLG